MRKSTLVLAGLSLLMASSAMATTCAAGNYNDYYNGGSPITCTINNLQFSQFGFSPGGSVPPTASSIGVTVLNTLGNEGFEYNPAFSDAGSAISGQSSDAAISFEVTGLNGTLIDDLTIFFNGSFGGSGSTNYSETYCTISFSTGCNVFNVSNPSGPLSKTIDITPVTTLYITKDMVASAPTGVGNTASVSDVQNQFSNTSVPEPASLILLSTVLVGLGGLIRRRIGSV